MEYFDNIGVDQMRSNEVRWDQILLDRTRWNQMRSDDIELYIIILNWKTSDDTGDQKKLHHIILDSMSLDETTWDHTW